MEEHSTMDYLNGDSSRIVVSRSSSSVSDPYQTDVSTGKRVFVGGAQKARGAARKKKGKRILNPLEKQHLAENLPKKLNSFERFFAALLRSSPSEYLADPVTVWNTICQRVNLTVPTKPLESAYRDPKMHFRLRAALVLEEARHSIAEPLSRIWKQRTKAPPGMGLSARILETSSTTGHSKVLLMIKNRKFTKDELFNIRSGGVFQCVPRESSADIESACLGVVITTNREQVEKKSCFTMMFFRKLPETLEDVVMTPITQLVTELRCFDAMTNNPTNIGFLYSILGQKNAQHTRFDEADEKIVADKENDATLHEQVMRDTKLSSSSGFRLAPLNATQEQAAEKFLNAPKHSLHLVQGPPGTGKTTLLISIICRYLSMSGDCRRRLLVCAPTNKAVSVLATRFLASLPPNSAINAVLVGDADKLLAEDTSLSIGTVESIFLYTWVENVIRDYTSIKNYFQLDYKRQTKSKRMYTLAFRLEQDIIRRLPFLSKKLSHMLSDITKSVELTSSDQSIGSDVATKIDKLITEINGINSDDIWAQILTSADVVFCTLATAGNSVMKRSPKVNDLIIDEAAAATEPELSIPFHLKPSRLLAVGDPLQLPATILSQRAADLGLSKSLHERLMYDCGVEYIMLDVQYRMKPNISSFPSMRFYDSKINNGPNVSRDAYGAEARLLMDCQPYRFVQVNGVEEQEFSGSYRNKAEALKVVKAVIELQKMATASKDLHWYSSDRVRVITFYQAQVSLIKRLLRENGLEDKVMVATVDSSQGCEADIVLISFVRSQDANVGRHTAGFLNDDRRMNVALTRAKYQLICFGNVTSFHQMVRAETLKMLASDAQSRDCILRMNNTEMIDLEHFTRKPKRMKTSK